MPDMAARHEEPLVADHGLLAAGDGAEVEGGALADDVVGADDEAGILALELQVLRRLAERCARDRR